MGQSLRAAVDGLLRLATAPRERVQSPGLEVCGALVRPLVPRRARLRVAIAGPRVADDQRARHLRVREREGQGDVAAERETTDDGALDAQVLQQRLHVGDDERGGVVLGVVGTVRLAVAAHVPGDDAPAIGERAMLVVPHVARGAVTVAEEHHRAVAGHVVIDLDAVEPRLHRGLPARALDRARGGL
jgi:hypothetical protein